MSLRAKRKKNVSNNSSGGWLMAVSSKLACSHKPWAPWRSLAFRSRVRFLPVAPDRNRLWIKYLINAALLDVRARRGGSVYRKSLSDSFVLLRFARRFKYLISPEKKASPIVFGLFFRFLLCPLLFSFEQSLSYICGTCNFTSTD